MLRYDFHCLPSTRLCDTYIARDAVLALSLSLLLFRSFYQLVSLMEERRRDDKKARGAV